MAGWHLVMVIFRMPSFNKFLKLIFLMVATTVAASCAFMLPVATPPNAVVFGSGHLRIPDMVRAGIWINVISIFLISLFVYFLLPSFWNFDPTIFPEDFLSQE